MGTIEAMPNGKFRGVMPGRGGRKLPSCDTREEAEERLDYVLTHVAQGLPFRDAVKLRRGHFVSFVYFIQEETSGFIKIGRTKDPDTRLYHLQSHSPHAVKLLCVIPGGPCLERTFHVAFATDRRRGEWFEPGPAMRALVTELVRVWGEPFRKPSLTQIVDSEDGSKGNEGSKSLEQRFPKPLVVGSSPIGIAQRLPALT